MSTRAKERIPDLNLIFTMIPKNVAMRLVLNILMGMAGPSPAANAAIAEATEQSSAVGKGTFVAMTPPG